MSINAASSAFVANQRADTREVTEDVIGTLVDFDAFDLGEEVRMGLRRLNFKAPTPVQEKSIPAVLSGRDVVARGKNGTGKTASFVIPLLQVIDHSKPGVQALVVVSTRELAQQVSMVVKNLAYYCGDVSSRVMCATGGVDRADDIKRLSKNPIVVVGTPGRLLDLISSKNLSLASCRIFVADEADQLLQASFLETLENIIGRLPSACQRCFFSATYGDSVATILPRLLREPEMVNAMEDSIILMGITQYVAFVPEQHKIGLLRRLLCQLHINQCIVFVNTTEECAPLHQILYEKQKMSVLYTSARLSLNERSQVYHDFANGQARILVATDLITRGIDVRTVNVVINFDCPHAPDVYLHRIGRAGRYGHRGISITFVSSDRDRQNFMHIDAALKAIRPFTVSSLPPDLNDIPIELYDASALDTRLPSIAERLRALADDSQADQARQGAAQPGAYPPARALASPPSYPHPQSHAAFGGQPHMPPQAQQVQQGPLPPAPEAMGPAGPDAPGVTPGVAPGAAPGAPVPQQPFYPMPGPYAGQPPVQSPVQPPVQPPGGQPYPPSGYYPQYPVAYPQMYAPPYGRPPYGAPYPYGPARDAPAPQ